jgi:hypothetical protein
MYGHPIPVWQVAVAWLILLALAATTALAATAIVSRRHRRRISLAAAWTLGGFVAVYAVGRGIAEFFTVPYNNPARYQSSWGGPSLAGVFLVHSGPGFLVLVAAAVFTWRRLRRRIGG